MLLMLFFAESKEKSVERQSSEKSKLGKNAGDKSEEEEEERDGKKKNGKEQKEEEGKDANNSSTGKM
jgi:hypothetical protein